jgi:tetratricopeptide (TPR) repeat protein
MSTDPTLASKGTETVFPNPPGNPPNAEDARLDDAIRRADDLLVQSLRVEERERRRRNLRRLFIPIGVLVMLAVAYKTALILGLLGPVATGLAAKDPARAEQLAQEGWQLWQQRQLTDAEVKFAEAVTLDPSLVMAWNGFGWAHFNQGKYGEAEKAFKRTLELEPGHAAAENGLGQLSFAQRKYDQAEKHFLESVKTPGANAAWYGLAKLYLLRAQWDKAAEWSQKLVDAGSADAQPILDAAKAKKIPADLRQQITPPAPDASAKTSPAAPSDASIQKGWQQLNKGQSTQSIATFNALLAKDPSDANALNGLGWALLRSPGKQSEAKDAFEKAIKADPNAAGAINGLAVCLKNEGKTDEAIKLWQQMVEKQPTMATAGHYQLATIYVQRKQFDKALPLAETLAKSDPANAEIQQLLQQAKTGASK